MTTLRTIIGWLAQVSALIIVAGTAAVMAQAPSAAADPWWGWVLLGRLHPVVVHFPIGLLLAGACFEGVQWLRGRPLPTEVGTFCLSAGLLFGALAVWFGTLNAGHQSITGASAEILEWHRYAGWAAVVVGTAALLAGRVAHVRPARRVATTYAVLLLACGGLVGATGHFGGQLVYGSTYITSVLPWQAEADAPAVAAVEPTTIEPATIGPAPVEPPSAEPARVEPARTEPAPIEPARIGAAPIARVPSAPAATAPAPAPAPAPASAPTSAAAPAPEPQQNGVVASPAVREAPVAARVDFARHIEPIFRAACVECHGPDKVKARLRMDSVAHLQQGGKNGALFVAGDPETSLLMRRVLGLDGEDQMPLDADPLPPEQIDTLRQWIREGARYDAAPRPDSPQQP